jgi:hypothetical protein
MLASDRDLISDSEPTKSLAAPCVRLSRDATMVDNVVPQMAQIT